VNLFPPFLCYAGSISCSCLKYIYGMVQIGSKKPYRVKYSSGNPVNFLYQLILFVTGVPSIL
jgi:hypothetical protein